MTAPLQSPHAARAATAAPAATATNPAEPLLVVTRPRKERPYHLWILLGIVLVAGLLRFFELDRPTLWHQEVVTIQRLTNLALTPVVARMLPALAGTLLPAAVYWLASRFVSRRTALVAAAVAACSAWTLTFSREAQAHAPLWLLATAAVAGALSLSRAGVAQVVAAAVVLPVAAWLFEAQTSPAAEVGPGRSAIAFFTGVLVPTADQQIFIPKVGRRWMTIGIVTILLPLLIGLIPWPRRWRATTWGKSDDSVPRWMLPACLAAWLVLALLVRRPSFFVPAVSLIAAVLLMRIPTRPLRWMGVAMACGMNVAVAAMPFLAHVEPPVDQVARDVWQARDPDGTVRTFVQYRDGSTERGGGTIFNVVGRYYLAVESRGTEPVPPVTRVAFANELIRQVERTPHLERIIVWDHFIPIGGVAPEETLEQRLPPNWRRVSEGHRPVFGPSWQYRYTARRREYVRSLAVDAESQAH